MQLHFENVYQNLKHLICEYCSTETLEILLCVVSHQLMMSVTTPDSGIYSYKSQSKHSVRL